MNDNEWKYILQTQRKLGGIGEVPPEMRSRDFLQVIETMTEGYVFTASVIADQRGRELPFWRRSAAKQEFLAAARRKASEAQNDAVTWLASDLFKLAKNGMPQVIHDAIRRGADSNGRNEKGWTPLMCSAAFNQNPDAVTTLLQAGADINARVAYEPMMLIHYAPDVSAETVLIDRSNCWTPLICAAVFNNNPQVLNALIMAGADINARDNLRRSLSEDAVQRNAKVLQGMTVLMLAAEHTKNPEVILALTRAGADVLARDGSGWTALMYAAQSNPNHEVITALLTEGAEINARNVFGGTSLKIAKDFNQRSPGVIAALLRAGATSDGNP